MQRLVNTYKYDSAATEHEVPVIKNTCFSTSGSLFWGQSCSPRPKGDLLFKSPPSSSLFSYSPSPLVNTLLFRKGMGSASPRGSHKQMLYALSSHSSSDSPQRPGRLTTCQWKTWPPPHPLVLSLPTSQSLFIPLRPHAWQPVNQVCDFWLILKS